MPRGRPRKDPGLKAEEAKMYQQVPIRVHRHDHAAAKVLFAQDGLNWQRFVRTCLDAYLRGNGHMLKMLKDQAVVENLPKEVLDRYTLSQRERQSMLEVIEKELDKQRLEDPTGAP